VAEQASVQSSKQSQEAYYLAGSRAAPRAFSRRTAEQQAAFFLPHLQAGMDLLDCGCGPGSITIGLARVVAPGRAVGIDIDASQIELAQTNATDQAVANLRFETATLYALPFADRSLDAVFSHAVLTYLQDPLAALREIRRVLKPGGVAGIRVADHEGQLCAPPDLLVLRSWHIFDALIQQNGGNPFLGKQLRGLCRKAGFVKTQAGASYQCFSSEETTRQLATTFSDLLSEADYIRKVVDLGLAERAELARISQAWQAWGEHPDAFLAVAYCEVVAWKD
jgi:ubiquinone/menaquinone biosynthesis C-methylase UbiE